MTPTRESLSARDEVLKLLEEMRSAAKRQSFVHVDHVSDRIEMLVRTYLEPAVLDPCPGVALTKLEGRILARLALQPGSIVSKQKIMDALYFDRPGDEPGDKVIDVLMFRIRKKLAGRYYQIENVHGQGFRLWKVEHAKAA